MKNYIIAGVVLVIVILGFVFMGNKTEAPLQQNENTEQGVVAALSDGQYRLNTEASAISWQGEYLTGLTEQGTVKLESGEVTVEGGLITGGEFTIDMSTIESEPHKEKLVSHLKSDDFFGVETNPTAKFVFKSMTPTSAEGAKTGRFVVAGDLTVKGITKPISFMTTLSTPSEGTLKATSELAINRADWEIKYNSASFFSDLGDKIIRDAVSIGLDLQAEKVIQ